MTYRLWLLLLVNTFFMINTMEKNILQKRVRSTHPAFHQYAHEWQQKMPIPLITGVALLFFAWVIFEKTITVSFRSS